MVLDGDTEVESRRLSLTEPSLSFLFEEPIYIRPVDSALILRSSSCI